MLRAFAAGAGARGGCLVLRLSSRAAPQHSAHAASLQLPSKCAHAAFEATLETAMLLDGALEALLQNSADLRETVGWLAWLPLFKGSQATADMRTIVIGQRTGDLTRARLPFFMLARPERSG